MKKELLNYEAPAVECIELQVERGFTLSNTGNKFGDYDADGDDAYLD